MIQFTKPNYKVIIPVVVMCTLSLAIFFVSHSDRRVEFVVANADVEDTDTYDETAYYIQQAEEFVTTLPSDKAVVASLVDKNNHHVIYYETTLHPSCYIYDLETMTTSVLFGGEEGFYIGTKLLILGSIRECNRMGDYAIFVATNNAPEAVDAGELHVFMMNLRDHSLKYVD